MPSLQKALLTIWFLIVTAPSAATAQDQIFRHEYDHISDTFIQVDSVFGMVARHGSLPFRITIRNNSGEDREWTVTLKEGSSGRPMTTTAGLRIAVENGAEVVREVTLPYAPAFLAYDYRNLEVFVHSPGLPSQNRSQGSQTNQSFPSLAISRALARRSLAKLDDLVKQANSANPVFAKPFEASLLPGTWLGFTGIDALLIDLPSWQALSVAQRQALITWIRLGGRADIYTDVEAPLHTLNLPGKRVTGNAHQVSLGEIRLLQWDGVELDDDVIKRYDDLPIRSAALEQDFSTNWGMQKEFGVRDFNPAIIFLILVAFAILVAPVNLFFLAGPGRRHRLFITTPLISILTCLVIVIAILFIDGLGGRGIRAVVADLQPGPGEMRLYLSQEQISRTGVMLNTGFKQSSEYDISPTMLPAGGLNPFSHNGRSSTTYEFGYGHFRGGFFQSRAEQAFSIRSVEATRSRIEVRYPDGKEGAPRLVSSIADPLTSLLYIDHAGENWVMPAGIALSPGATIALQKSASSDWPDWIKETTSRLSSSLRKQVESMKEDRNRFFAVPAGNGNFALPTHPGIDWEKTAVILTGTPISSTPSAETAAPPARPSPDSNE